MSIHEHTYIKHMGEACCMRAVCTYGCTQTCIQYGHVLHAANIHEPPRWVGRVPMRQKSFLIYHLLVLKSRHLSGSAYFQCDNKFLTRKKFDFDDCWYRSSRSCYLDSIQPSSLYVVYKVMWTYITMILVKQPSIVAKINIPRGGSRIFRMVGLLD